MGEARRRCWLALLATAWALTACTQTPPPPDGAAAPVTVESGQAAAAATIADPSATPLPASSVPPTSAASSTTAGRGDNLMWADEFDGTALNSSWWSFEHPFMGLEHGSVHLYTPDAVAVADGLLHITATRLATPVDVDLDADGTADRALTWSSGFITTRELVASGPGLVEVRLKAPAGQGLWPAVWLRPASGDYGGWPRSGELDVVEILGGSPHEAVTTAHWWNGGHMFDARTTVLQDTDDGFHIYALRWGPDELVWSIDGTVVHRLSDWRSDLGPPGSPFDRSFYLNINLAVGGRWPGAPDEGTPEPSVLEVDWIRVHGPS